MIKKSRLDPASRLGNVTGKEKIEVLNELAGDYQELSPNDRITFAEQAIDLSEEFHDQQSKAEAYNHLGVAYNNLGNSPKSIDYFLKALKIMEQLNDKNGIACSYVNIGQANFYLDNFDKALEYFQKALKIREEIGDKRDISQSLILIGNVRGKTEKYDRALDCYFKALEIKKGVDDKDGMSQIYNNLGEIYSATGQPERALEYRLKGLQICRELGMKWEIAITTFNIAEYFLQIKHPEKAYPYMLESRELSEKLDNKGLTRDNLYNFSLYYEQKEDYQKALEFQREYSELTKSLFSEELSEKFTEIQIKYETERLEDAIKERTRELQQNIEDLEQTKKALMKSEQRLDLAINGTGLGLWTWGIRTGETTYSRQWAKMLGYSIEEIEAMSNSWKDFVHPDDKHQMMEIMNNHFEGKTAFYEAEVRMRTKSGEWKWILSTGKVFERDDDGRPLRITGLHRDITKRMRAEKERELLLEQIKGQTQQLMAVINTVPDGVFVLDTDNRVLLANRVAKGDLAVLADVKVGDTLTYLGDRPLAELLASPPKGLWHEVAGDSRTFEVIARPMKGGLQSKGWVIVINDVTKARERQRRVQQQERLAAVGQLASGIAHDFNNILAVIVLYTEMALRLPDLPHELSERLRVIFNQANRGGSLIQQILDFSRRTLMEPCLMDLVPFMQDQVKMLKRTLPESIEISMTCDPGNYTINADPTRMEQAFLNLAINARDAMPEGGELRIGLKHLRIEESKRAPLPEMKVGEWIRVTVADTGEGIPTDEMPHLFEPFFTTKAPGNGTGLGLAQVYGIVKQHNGYIDVTSQVGKGTTFTIYVPAMDIQPLTEPLPESTELVHGNKETILVVEDEQATRQAIYEILESLNYRPLCASDGQKALALLNDDAETIDMLLSDMVMPKMGGMELYQQMLKMHLDIPLLLMTGYPLGKNTEILLDRNKVTWIQKPVNLQTLSNAIAKIIQKKL
jgi:PAS domain S-box-containing protein